MLHGVAINIIFECSIEAHHRKINYLNNIHIGTVIKKNHE